MITGVGTDIIEVERVKNKVSENEGFAEGIFTSSEIKYCESKKTKYQYYAGRYAAKEAFFKALGTGWRYGMQYLEIEISNDNLGKPIISLTGNVQEFCKGQNIQRLHLSIAHTKQFATAVVIAENQS